MREVCPKNKWRGNVWSFRLRFINDNVAMRLSYLRKYGEYRITVATLNRPFVLPHRTSSRCLSSVHTICQAFWTSETVSFDPTGRHSSPNLAVQYPKNVSYYNFEPSFGFALSTIRRRVRTSEWARPVAVYIDISALFTFLCMCIEQWHHGAMRKLNIVPLWNFHNHESVL